ncbi:MAG: S49 family peptidase [Salinirussus sp.]
MELTDTQQLVVVVLAAAVAGVALWPVVTGATSGTTSTVAVVEIEGPIFGSLADDVEQELREIRQNESVEAVVLKMDTPGGAPAASERMYMAVQRTAKEMPVVASVQAYSASGGYYTMLPAEPIYVLPTSVTGSVGLAAGAPEAREPVRGPSGPNKRGGTVIGQWAVQETLADTFIDTVMAQRGAELNVSRSEVSKAKVYLGTRAVQNGFADRIGSLDAAIREAADQAGLEQYRVVTRETGGGLFPFLLRTDAGIVAVRASDPGYGQVEYIGPAFVHAGSVPHVDTVDDITRAEIESARTDRTEPGGSTNATAVTGGVGT